VNVFAIGKTTADGTPRECGPRAIEERDRTRDSPAPRCRTIRTRRAAVPCSFRSGRATAMMSPTVSSEFRAHVGLRQDRPRATILRGRAGSLTSDGGEIFRGAPLVSQPQDAASVLGDLDRHTPRQCRQKPVELVMCEFARKFQIAVSGICALPLIGVDRSTRWPHSSRAALKLRV